MNDSNPDLYEVQSKDDVFELSDYVSDPIQPQKFVSEDLESEDIEEAIQGDTNENETTEAALKMMDLDSLSNQSSVNVVQYDPESKPKRLGRPRNKLNLSTDSNTSSENLDKAVMSKFRFDQLPVEGPGSRGGNIDKKRTPRGKLFDGKRKKQQSLLNFVKDDENKQQKQITNDNLQKIKLTKNKVTPTSVSRTSVLSKGSKGSRQLPGPLIHLSYDLYDDNLLNEHEDVSKEKLSLGYPIKPNPYANDIVYIISFLNKFQKILKIDPISPHDIENGLSLPQQQFTSNRIKYNPKESETMAFDSSYVSPLMNSLFYDLLTVVLNKKKKIHDNNLSKSIIELKSLINYLGLPKEWRDDSQILVKEKFVNDNQPVDPNMTDIFINEKINYNSPEPIENPFMSKEFEANGLEGISNPKDRLILLRCLCQWSLIISNDIKNYITSSLQNQDMSGDKETFYGSRSILKGFIPTESLKKEIDSKLKKRKNLNNLEINKYLNPVSNPLDHSMNLRLDELCIADVGFHIGRFFLVRMSNENNGGLNSVDKLNYIWSNKSNEYVELPSKFKLFVQDIHSMLTDSLDIYGIEFDEDGNELPSEAKANNIYWYEVASNIDELSDFIHFLEKKLGVNDPEGDGISKNSIIYKPVKNLYNYLSSSFELIAKQEELRTFDGKTRSSRKKIINYSDVDSSNHFKKLIDSNEDANEDNDIPQIDNDDNEDYEELEEFDNDDGEDEDYSE